MRTGIGFVLMCAALLAAPSAWAKGEKGKADLNCYQSIANSEDHMVLGCEIPGYHMRYDLAKPRKIFMVLLPDGADGFEQAQAYFALDTFPLYGGSVQSLFEADWKGTAKKLPGSKVVKRLKHVLHFKGVDGPCFGQTVVYPKGHGNLFQSKRANFRYETYYFCRTGSRDYALFASLEAVSQKALDKATPAFMKWLDQPQMVMPYDPAKDKLLGTPAPGSD